MKSQILLIDDEKELLSNFKELLEIKGFAVDTASSGNKGITKMRTKIYDLILSDLMMSDGDGYEALKYVRSSEKMSNTPFIFLTAKQGKENHRKGIDEGAEDYLTKPRSINELEKAILTALSKKKNREKYIQTSIAKAIANERNVKLHELRTPFFGIFSALQILKSDRGKLSSEFETEIIETAYLAAKRMNHSLSNLNRWVEITKRSKLIKIDNDITKLISQTISPESRFLCLASAPPKFLFDKEDLEFIVNELIINAEKFSRDGKAVEIKVEESSFTISNAQFIFDSDQEFLPEPFSQIGRQKDEQQGLGLGLYLAKQYAEDNNFTLTSKIVNSLFQVKVERVAEEK